MRDALSVGGAGGDEHELRHSSQHREPWHDQLEVASRLQHEAVEFPPKKMPTLSWSVGTPTTRPLFPRGANAMTLEEKRAASPITLPLNPSTSCSVRSGSLLKRWSD